MKTFLANLRARFSRPHHSSQHTRLVIVDVSSFHRKSMQRGLSGLIHGFRAFSTKEKIPLTIIITGSHSRQEPPNQHGFVIHTVQTPTERTRLVAVLVQKKGAHGIIVVSSTSDIIAATVRAGAEVMSPSTFLKGLNQPSAQPHTHERHPHSPEQRHHRATFSPDKSPAQHTASPENHKQGETKGKNASILDLIDPL